MPGVNSLGICVETLANPLKGSVPLMPHLPESDPAPGLPERGRCFAQFFWARQGCLHREPGGRRSAWALLCDSLADMDRLRARRRGRGRAVGRDGARLLPACLRGRGKRTLRPEG